MIEEKNNNIDSTPLIGEKLRNNILSKSTCAAVLMTLCGGLLYLRYLKVDSNIFDSQVIAYLFGFFLLLFISLLLYNIYHYRCPKCKVWWVYLLKIQYVQAEQFRNKKIFWFSFCLRTIEYIREYVCYSCGKLNYSRGKSYSLIKEDERGQI